MSHTILESTSRPSSAGACSWYGHSSTSLLSNSAVRDRGPIPMHTLRLLALRVKWWNQPTEHWSLASVPRTSSRPTPGDNHSGVMDTMDMRPTYQINCTKQYIVAKCTEHLQLHIDRLVQMFLLGSTLIFLWDSSSDSAWSFQLKASYRQQMKLQQRNKCC